MRTHTDVGTLFLVTLVLSILFHRTLLHLSHRQGSTISRAELSRFECVGCLSYALLASPWLTRPFSSRRPHLVLTSLLLAHLTPTFLLSLLLLWHSKPAAPAPQSDRWQWDENSIDWAIRSLVGGLSSGVALGGECQRTADADQSAATD